MKRFLLFTLLCLCTGLFTQAQLKPQGGSVGLGFRVTGLFNVGLFNFQSSGLSGADFNDPTPNGAFFGIETIDEIVPQQMVFGRYYVTSDIAVRLGLGINNISAKTTAVDSLLPNQITTTNTKLSAFSFGLSVGGEKHFASAASRLDPYVGLQFDFGRVGTLKNETSEEVTPDPIQINEVVTELDGGSSFGVNAIAGFNYFFTDNFALGGEFSWGYNTMSVGGDWVENSTTSNAGNVVESQQSGTAKSSTGGFRVGSTSGINASIFF